MSMIEVHSKAIDSIAAIYHEFLGRFNKLSKKVFGFVEGKEDLSFYYGFIEQVISGSWQIDLWHTGNKDKVLELYSCFDWGRFSKHQIAFFIDRDLSNFLGDDLPDELNIFITDGYSIENHIVNRSTCDRLLCEVLNLSVLPKEEKDKILNLFDEQLIAFAENLLPTMAWILHWKRSGEKPCLNDILMKYMFTLDHGKLDVNNKPKNHDSIAEYIHSQCNIPYVSSLDISHIEREIRNAGKILLFIRGKYLLWFLVEFALTIYKDIAKLSSSIKSPPKLHVSLSQSNGNVLVAPRSRIPESLRLFLKATFSNFIQNFKNAA